jgi:negative regulator of sigma E activity
MTDIPKIVYNRLRVPQLKDAALAGSHPDIDLLTAFMEQAVTPPGRESVLGHLARCEECREIVALALPAAEIFDGRLPAQEIPGQVPVREEDDRQVSIPIATRRNRWFGFARPNLGWAALAAGVAVVASMLVLHPLQQKQAMLPTSNQTVAENLPLAADSQAVAQSQPSAEVSKRKASPPIGSKNERSNPGAAALVADNRYPGEEALIARKPASPIEKAKPALQNDEMQATSASTARAFKWKISAGVLERSFDGGRSWQIGLRADHPLLCYASRGQDIWVGGQAGTLLHSNDDGLTWAQVRASDDESLSADVTRIDLRNTDVANGSDVVTEIVVSTGTGEVWNSIDGGNTWNRQ